MTGVSSTFYQGKDRGRSVEYVLGLERPVKVYVFDVRPNQGNFEVKLDHKSRREGFPVGIQDLNPPVDQSRR